MSDLVGLVFFSTLAVGCAVGILKLKKPEQIAISAAIISAPWWGGLWLNFIKFDLRLTYVFIIIAFAVLISKKVRFDKKHRITYSIMLPTFCLIAWSTISATQAYDSAVAMGAVFTFIFNLMFLITINKAVNDVSDVDYILKSLFIGLFFTSLLGLIQYKRPFTHIGFADRDFTTFMFWRTRSTFHHANQFGTYQMFLLPLLFRQIIIMFQQKSIKLVRIYGVLFLMSSFTLYTTGNRGSWIGLAIGMIITIGMDFFRRSAKKTRKVMARVLFVFMIILMIASIRYGPRIYDRFYGEWESNANKQMESRSQLNEDAYKIIRAHPYLGVGMMNYNFYTSIIFTHNVFLLIISEVGFPGLILFLWQMIGFFRESRKGMKIKNFYVSNINSGFMAVMLGFLLASFVGPDYWVSYQVSVHLWILLGIIVSLNRLYFYQERIKLLQKKKQQFEMIKEGQIVTAKAV